VNHFKPAMMVDNTKLVPGSNKVYYNWLLIKITYQLSLYTFSSWLAPICTNWYSYDILLRYTNLQCLGKFINIIILYLID